MGSGLPANDEVQDHGEVWKMSVEILQGNCLDTLKTLPADSVQCCVTSPPYYQQRDYGTPDQLGQEHTPIEYVANLISVFTQIRRILKPNGTFWLNIGDKYDNGRLLGIPWRVVFACEDSGWVLRQDIIWAKKNPMPESIKTRCTRAHEYLFLMTKSAPWYFNADAIKEPQAAISIRRAFSKNSLNQRKDAQKSHYALSGAAQDKAYEKMRASIAAGEPQLRNKWSVWNLSTANITGAHFAPFPTELVETCLLAGTQQGDTVLDPFAGSGTVGVAAQTLNRNAVLCELNPDYVRLIEQRVFGDAFQ